MLKTLFWEYSLSKDKYAQKDYVGPSVLLMCAVAKGLRSWNTEHDINVFYETVKSSIVQYVHKYPASFSMEKLSLEDVMRDLDWSGYLVLACVPIGLIAVNWLECKTLVSAVAQVLGMYYTESDAAEAFCKGLLACREKGTRESIVKETKWSFSNEWHMLEVPRLYAREISKLNDFTSYNLALKALYLVSAEKDPRKLYDDMLTQWGRDPFLGTLVGSLSGAIYNYKNKEAGKFYNMLPEEIQVIVDDFKNLKNEWADYPIEQLKEPTRFWRNFVTSTEKRKIVHPIICFDYTPQFPCYKLTFLEPFPPAKEKVFCDLRKSYICISVEDYRWVGYFFNKHINNFNENSLINLLKSNGYCEAWHEMDAVIKSIRENNKSTELTKLLAYIKKYSSNESITENDWKEFLNNRYNILSFYEAIFWYFHEIQYMNYGHMCNITRKN